MRAETHEVTSHDVAHHEAVMGTVVSYLARPGDLGRADVARAIGESTAELHRLEAVFSTWQEDSPMSRYRRGELADRDIPAEMWDVLDLCAAAKHATRGWFDPWALPSGVDPTGLVKGWAIELATGVLARLGIPSALVNGGGDVQSLGSPAAGESGWRVGVRHPWRADALACIAEVPSDYAIATSGTYERGEHLLDPFALRGSPGPADRLVPPRPAVVSATVVGPSLARADAYATALAVAGGRGDPVAEALAREGYDSYRIFADGSEEVTDGFQMADPAPAS